MDSRRNMAKRIAITRAVLGGATFKTAGESANVGTERARQLYLHTLRLLRMPKRAPPDMEKHEMAFWNVELARREADYWTPLLDALEVEFAAAASRTT